MEKQVLKEKILKAVGLNEKYIDDVYNSFLNKISDVLLVNQTIKFEDLGFFQLRIEPVSRLNRDSAKKSNKILIFKSIESEDQILQENLFLTFDLEPENTQSSAFSESVFNLSIDDPSTILDESKPEDSNQSDDYLEESIHDYVNQFISCGIIIDGYEVLNKGAGEKIDDDETLSSDIIKEVSSNEPIVPILEPEEPLDKTSNIEAEAEEAESSSQHDETSSEIASDSIVEPKKESVPEPEDEKKNPFDELSDLINKAKEEPQTEEKIDSQAAYNEVKSSARSNDSGNKRLIILALAAVFIILLTAIIYFTTSSSSTSSQVQSYLDEKVDTKTEDIKPAVKADSTVSNSSKNKETSSEVVLLKEETKEPVPYKKVIKTSYTGLYRKIIKDVSITDRIYYDDQKYTVQISSWRSKTIAEHEVQKLKKLGFDAFIYRVYIKSKDGTWNRVRIGYFDSKKEASEFLKRNKL